MFWKRLLSGAVLLVLAVGTFYVGGIPLLVLLGLASAIAFRELTKALKCATDDKKWNGLECLGILGVIIYYVLLGWKTDATTLLLAIVGMLMSLMFVYVVAFPKYRCEQIAAAFMAFFYAPVLLSFVYLTRDAQNGFYLVWMILISSWGSDTCAYVIGMLFGKKKVFPVLSPKKSLEGCIGGVLGCAGLGWLYGCYFLETYAGYENAAWAVAVICAGGAAMSMIGDLAASAIKRNQEIKDYGKLIPGHGGVMDRIDSMVATAPMVYLLALLTLV